MFGKLRMAAQTHRAGLVLRGHDPPLSQVDLVEVELTRRSFSGAVQEAPDTICKLFKHPRVILVAQVMQEVLLELCPHILVCPLVGFLVAQVYLGQIQKL